MSRGTIIFYLPYRPTNKIASSSQIRPLILKNEFLNQGFEIIDISGTIHERKYSLIQLKKLLETGQKIKFAYCENSTIPNFIANRTLNPINLFFEYNFFRLLKRNRIPISLFYRDIHWRFHLTPMISSSLKSFVIKYIYPVLHRFDLFVYRKFLNIVFLPSREMKTYLPELSNVRGEELPPGLFPEKEKSFNNYNAIRLLYVGGLSEIYNLKLLLEVVSEFDSDSVQITVCTREKDFFSIENEYCHFFENDNIHLVHKKGSELDQLYSEADICCLFFKPIEYHSFMMPVKLFEYASHNKPILCSPKSKFGEVVEENNIGWMVEYNKAKLNEWLKSIIDLGKDQNNFTSNLEAFIAKSTWEKRVKHVVNCINSLDIK